MCVYIPFLLPVETEDELGRHESWFRKGARSHLPLRNNVPLLAHEKI